MIKTTDIVIPIVLGILINAISGYLLYNQILNINLFLFIVIGSIFVIVIIINQRSNYDIENRMDNLEQNQKRLEEKLKIYEQLITIKAEIKELQKEVFKK